MLSFGGIRQSMTPTLDGRNPAPVDMIQYPVIHKVLYIQTVVVRDFFHQQYDQATNPSRNFWVAQAPRSTELISVAERCNPNPGGRGDRNLRKTCRGSQAMTIGWGILRGFPGKLGNPNNFVYWWFFTNPFEKY